MTARGYQIFAWLFIGFGFYAMYQNAEPAALIAIVAVSFICHAASDILKAVSK